MIGKNVFYWISFLLLTISCLSDNGEDLKIDCTAGDLSLQLVQKTDASCNGPGGFEVAAQGGTAPFEFSLDGVAFTGSGMFSGLSGGQYGAFVRDANGCISELTVTLSGVLSLEAVSAGCEDGSGQIIVAASGGDGNYEYRIDDGSFGADGSFLGLNFGQYNISVRDGQGCEFTQSVKVGVSLQGDIFPIIQANCALPGCHLNVRSPLYETKEDVIQAANRIKARTSAGTMPPTGSLPVNEVALIAQWVDCGAQNN